MIADDLLASMPADQARVLRPFIERAVVLHPQNVVNYFFDSPDEFTGFDCIPSPIPPWPRIWCEWRMPRLLRIGDKSMAFPNLPMGALVSSVEIEGGGWAVDFAVYAPNGMMVVTRDVLDAQGDILEDPDRKNCMIPPAVVATADAQGLNLEQLGGLSTMFVKPLLMAFAFANCRNVEARATPVPKPLQAKRAARGRVRVTRTYELMIEPMKRVLATEGRSGEHGVEKALHICRGHFKNYDAKPLFGRLRGRYWWAAQARGTAAAGTVEKTYGVKGQP